MTQPSLDSFSNGKERYDLFQPLAAGGMATVHLARHVGPSGFTRTVAIKRLHAHLARDPQFVAMLLDEAHLTARIRHANVVITHDLVVTQGELLQVMEYIHGQQLRRLCPLDATPARPLPFDIAAAIMNGALLGLHAAHELRSERDVPLDVVHRDVSPQNIIVGADGVARVLDFGIAKARERLHATQIGQVKGKVAYMAPELITGALVTRQSDVYAAGVVLWELLTGRRLRPASDPIEAVGEILKQGSICAASDVNPLVPEELDRIILRACAFEAKDRFSTALEMASEIQRSIPVASQLDVGRFVQRTAYADLLLRSRLVLETERLSSAFRPPMPAPSSDCESTVVAPREIASDDALDSSVEELDAEDVKLDEGQDGAAAPANLPGVTDSVVVALAATNKVAAEHLDSKDADLTPVCAPPSSPRVPPALRNRTFGRQIAVDTRISRKPALDSVVEAAPPASARVPQSKRTALGLIVLAGVMATVLCVRWLSPMPAPREGVSSVAIDAPAPQESNAPPAPEQMTPAAPLETAQPRVEAPTQSKVVPASLKAAAYSHRPVIEAAMNRCDPPIEIDERGDRRLKAGCF